MQEYHPIAIKTKSIEDSIVGQIFEITTDKLMQTDAYEVNAYERVLETFESGQQAWIYVKK